jgi:hypothetical protein
MSLFFYFLAFPIITLNVNALNIPMRAGRVARMVQCLYSKHEALSSNPSTCPPPKRVNKCTIAKAEVIQLDEEARHTYMLPARNAL